MTLFFRVLMLGITIFVIVLMKYDRKKNKPVEDKMLANNITAEFRPITSSELFYADILYSRLKSYYIKLFGIGLFVDAFFVGVMVTNSDREAVARYGMYIALISIIVLHLVLSFSGFVLLKQIRLGEYKVMVGTLIDKRKVQGYENYVALLKNDREAFEEFVSYLTINVSEFYRNPEQWELMDKEIFPELIAKFGKNLKIWSAACSTGERDEGELQICVDQRIQAAVDVLQHLVHVGRPVSDDQHAHRPVLTEVRQLRPGVGAPGVLHTGGFFTGCRRDCRPRHSSA